MKRDLDYKKMYVTAFRLGRYNTWLQEVSEHYDIEKSVIISRCHKPNSVTARQTFYWLCWRDKINLYALSLHIGKSRTTVISTMNQGMKNREQNIEKLIYEKVTSQERKQRVKATLFSEGQGADGY